MANNRPTARDYRTPHKPRTAPRLPPRLMFDGKQARILLDQIRTIDKQRLAGKLGEIELKVWHPKLLEMLA